MSSIVLTGDTSGTVTVSAPAVAGTRTITLPAATGTAILEDASNNLQMNSGFGSSATAYGCRAWVNFNGSGTVAIRESGNVTSITDNGTGDYTVNFTTAMPDVNYCVVTATEIYPSSTSTRSGLTLGIKSGTTPTTSSVRLLSKNGANAGANAAEIDTSFANVAILR